ncbi:pyridoxal 5'-phosphate synthase subunit SNZERR-like isoform X8 [Dreissena polymorpha]|uniref:pyridoxal 5'-phosphate synthase subunit SNZERR-like isoform X8 n=1 Tax=Dreissena polymorpha TaxID=45954 RepID=UPI0022642FCA|nr:pyridoxal 5'-phosphate synthase subunit SNZERR-like isoform X8 [Dreissena polymorpha]
MTEKITNGFHVTNLIGANDRPKAGQTGTFKVKAGLAQMAKGGIIMDVTNAEEARIAEEAGACAVMALERVPADIRRDGGVVDESEVLTPADETNHINKQAFTVPFVCGARDLGEALRRIAEGAAMIRTKGLAGTGDVAEAVRHQRMINKQIKMAQSLDADELYSYAKELRVPIDLLQKTAELGRLPVVNFAAGGIATPADVSMMMQLGVDGVFVGSGIFKSSDPKPRAAAMAQAVTHFNDARKLAELSTDLGQAMLGEPRNDAIKKYSNNWTRGEADQSKIWNATLGTPQNHASY